MDILPYNRTIVKIRAMRLAISIFSFTSLQALGVTLERLPRVFHERWSGNLFTFSAGHKLVTITKLQFGSFSLLEAESLSNSQ